MLSDNGAQGQYWHYGMILPRSTGKLFRSRAITRDDVAVAAIRAIFSVVHREVGRSLFPASYRFPRAIARLLERSSALSS
jgi:hypothetical protein